LKEENKKLSNIAVIMNQKLGLKEIYPNVLQVLCIAAVLPMSTAEVERVFSQIKLIKNDHRNRLNQKTLQNLLHIKLNCDTVLFYSILENVVVKFFKVKQRRLSQL